MNTIPLVKGNTQEEINTSLIALKKVLNEMNSSSSKTDASVQSQIKQINELIENINSHLDTIDGQITDLQPVDSVTSGNMHSVTSNAVAEAFNSYTYENVTDKIEWNDNILLGSEAFLYKYGRLAHLVIFINVSSTSSEWNVIGQLKTPLRSSILIADTRGVGVCRSNGKGFNLVMSKDSFDLYAVITGGLSAGYCTAEMTYII